MIQQYGSIRISDRTARTSSLKSSHYHQIPSQGIDFLEVEACSPQELKIFARGLIPEGLTDNESAHLIKIFRGNADRIIQGYMDIRDSLKESTGKYPQKEAVLRVLYSIEN